MEGPFTPPDIILYGSRVKEKLLSTENHEAEAYEYIILLERQLMAAHQAIRETQENCEKYKCESNRSTHFVLENIWNHVFEGKPL